MLSFFTRLALCSAATWLAFKAVGAILAMMGEGRPEVRNVIALVGVAPLWGAAFARYLLGILPAIRDKARRDVCEPMNGRFYAYGNQRLRLYLVDGVIWIPERDLAAVMRPLPDTRELRLLGPDYATIPEQKLRGFTERGLLRMMTLRTAGRFSTHDMLRFKQWLENEALPNIRRLPASSSE